MYYITRFTQKKVVLLVVNK